MCTNCHRPINRSNILVGILRLKDEPNMWTICKSCDKSGCVFDTERVKSNPYWGRMYHKLRLKENLIVEQDIKKN